MRATTRGAQSNRVLSAILAFVLAFGCCGGGYYFGSGTEAAYAVSTPHITSPANNEAKSVAQNGTLNINISAYPDETTTDHLAWQWQVRDANDNDSQWADVAGGGNGNGAVGATITADYSVPTSKAGIFQYRCIVTEYMGAGNTGSPRGEATSNIYTVTVQAAQETTLPEGPSIVTQPTGVNYDQNLDGLDGRETIVLEQPLATSDVNGKFSKMEITVKQPYNVGGVITFKKENAKIYLVQNGGEAEIPASDVAVQNDDNGNIKFVFSDQYLNRSANGLPYNGAKVRMKLVGFVSNDMNTLRQYRTGDGSGATDDASIPYTIEAETIVSTKADYSLQNPYTMTPSQKNLVVSMPKLALTKTEIDGNTNTNLGSERQYRVTLTNQNANVPAKHLVITDNPERNYGLDIATSDVVVDKRTATGTVEHYSDAVVTKDGNGFKVDFGANSSLAGNEAYIVTYKMVSSSTDYFNALRQATKFTNTTKASADNAFAEASASLAMNILIPTASASATMPARTVLTTSEGGQVTVNFYMDGTEGVELINPTFTIGQTDTTGTATIENAQLTVRGQQGTYDMSSGSRKVDARIARPANPTSEPIATLTYTVKAPADSTGNNGNVTVTTSMTAENLLNAATTTASFTIAVPTANIRATVNNATPSASSEAEGVPATKVGVTVDAWQVADYAEIQEPLISIIDKAVDSSRNPVVADKFANLTVRYDGAILPVTVYPSEGEFNAALPALKNTATAAAFIDRSTDTLKIASGKYIAKDKHLVITYDDEMVKGSAANTGEEALSATIDNYSSAGNLPRSAHSETKYTMQDPSLFVGEVVTEPSDEMPIINFGDSAKFRTTFNTNNAAEYRNAQAKDFTLTINIDDILIGTKTYTPMEAGVSFVRKATIKDGDTDVSSQYKLEWGTDGASLTITAQDPAKILPYSAITVDYEVATSATGLHSDQIRGADISVTSRLTASNARADATSPSASVKIADAALGIKKKVAHQLIKKGDTDKYTITVSNVYAGSYSKARGVTVTDELDASAVKFGYAMDKSSLKVTLGGTDITSQTSVKWTKSKKFVLTVNQELAKGSDLVITYNGTTKGISSGSYSQDLTNVAVAEAYNAKPVVAMRTVTYNGAVAEDEVPSTNGNVIVNPTPSTPSGQMGEIGTGENGAGSSPLGGGGAVAGNNGDNGSAADGNNDGNGSTAAGDNNATAGSGGNGATANGSNASGMASDSAKAPAASQTASNTANSKSGSPSGMQSTGDELPITAGVILIVALVAAGSVAIVRRKRS